MLVRVEAWVLQSFESALSRCFQDSLLELGECGVVQNGSMVIQKREPKIKCNCMRFGLYWCSGESIYRLLYINGCTICVCAVAG